MSVLPEEIRAVLDDVEVRVLPHAPKGWCEHDRAMYQGFPARDDLEAEDDGDEPTLPYGVITLAADRFLEAEDVRRTVLHEVAHALGFDELEVSLMGLSDREVTSDAADSTVDLE